MAAGLATNRLSRFISARLCLGKSDHRPCARIFQGRRRPRNAKLLRSTKRQVLGKNVFNDNGETIGKIDDIIVAPDKAVSYAIIGAGGFLGVGRHDVAIPVGQLKENGGKFILPGGSKDAIKALPEFEYAHNQ